MPRTEALRQATGFGFCSAARQGGDGCGHAARRITIVSQAKGSQQAGQIGKTKVQAFRLALAPYIQGPDRQAASRTIGMCVKIAASIQKGWQVQNKSAFALGILPNFYPRRTAARKQQGAQPGCQGHRLISIAEQPFTLATLHQTLDPSFRYSRQGRRPFARGERRQCLTGLLRPRSRYGYGAKRRVRVSPGFQTLQRNPRPDGSDDSNHIMMLGGSFRVVEASFCVFFNHWPQILIKHLRLWVLRAPRACAIILPAVN